MLYSVLLINGRKNKNVGRPGQGATKVRLYFLGLKNKNELQEQVAKTQAAPIVAPIVEAIKTSKAVNRPPQSEEDVRRIFLQLQKMRFESLNRNQYIQFVARIYEDDNLFNTFLALNKDGFYKPPIVKMAKYRLVESLIFYGQGGRNLDMLPSNMQTERFKDRLNGFDEFYANNSESIRRVVKSQEENKPVRPQRRVILSDSDEDQTEEELQDLDEDSDQTEDDIPVTGEGLAIGGKEAVDRLSTLYSSKVAGNTSLVVNNEAQDILKTLLKRGTINKTKYHDLENLF